MYQTIEEIEKKYDGEWVFMTDVQMGKLHSVVGGDVAAHDANRDAVFAAMGKHPSGSVYVRYFGKMPENYAMLI
ncbi:hypothetical protein FACS1894139_13290 [Planctomycetales bacterium]|nr:hypothetical protein FACS1894107_09680 [Planctomycetales bacterium]GHT01455.1 hypothetical protein FACS1894108_15200 [Planctomycetales bacterium]GHT06740.1 hypothetical protein FACS1894139_13290 [Planctomycetales bacterium]